jgi:hypothetical protein
MLKRRAAILASPQSNSRHDPAPSGLERGETCGGPGFVLFQADHRRVRSSATDQNTAKPPASAALVRGLAAKEMLFENVPLVFSTRIGYHQFGELRSRASRLAAVI